MARVNLVEAITRSTAELLDAVRLATPHRTGDLAASEQSRIVETPKSVTGIVAVTRDFGKAGALEYGSHRTIDMKLSHVFGHLIPTMDVSRTLNIEAHDFLQGPEAAIADSALAGMRAALDKATEE